MHIKLDIIGELDFKGLVLNNRVLLSYERSVRYKYVMRGRL